MKRKILSLLLALLMLCGTATLFASCGEIDGYVELSGEVEVDLKNYAVVYANSVGKTRVYKNAITGLAEALGSITGERFIAKINTSCGINCCLVVRL